MAEPSLVIQGWVKAALDAVPGLAAAAWGDDPKKAVSIYDRVPTNPTGVFTGKIPYITIGQSETLPSNDEDGCEDGFIVNLTIQAFSTKPGFPEVKAIAALIYDALHEAEPVLSGFTVDHVLNQSMNFQRENDGLTSRAILQFEIGVHETA